MQWYVYKCNSRNGSHQNHYGHWRDFFDEVAGGESSSWGTSAVVPALSVLEPGDRILAYQTDCNSLMGLLEVDRWQVDHGADFVFLRPLIRLGRDGVEVRPMKTNPKIAEIHAFKTRQIKTIYDISSSDADYILDAAISRCAAQFFRT